MKVLRTTLTLLKDHITYGGLSLILIGILVVKDNVKGHSVRKVAQVFHVSLSEETGVR
jgi:hypothetical protein